MYIYPIYTSPPFTLPLLPSSPVSILTLITEPPTEHLLVSELSSVVDWFQLGLQLKVPSAELETIRADHHKTTDCRSSMLIWWLKHTESPTWSELARALLMIDKNLAQKLSVKYGTL